MPLPLILGIGATIAGAVGVGTGIHGAVKMKGANDTMILTKRCHKKNIERFEKENTVLLVGLLYNMCKVELVLKGKDEKDINTINVETVEKSITDVTAVLKEKF